MKKYDKQIYDEIGLEIISVTNGYQIKQREDSYVYGKLYYTKKECYEFINRIVDFCYKK